MGPAESRSIPEWDSVAHMMVIAEIEDAFDISMTTDDVIGMSSFKVAQDNLLRYGVDSLDPAPGRI